MRATKEINTESINSRALAVGIDGCKFGWISVCFNTEEVLLFKTIVELLCFYPRNTFFFFDIPIGLPDQQKPIRNCENQARKLLPKNKKSSIFPVPCREALQAENYVAASEINKKILGVGLSKQTWFITYKIKEMDDFLQKNPEFQSNIKESHPELTFQFLNRNQPLLHRKKTEKGISERLKILQDYQRSLGLYKKALSSYKRADVQKDDILDAMSLAIAANQPSESLRTIPKDTINDSVGIEMGIYYPEIMLNF